VQEIPEMPSEVLGAEDVLVEEEIADITKEEQEEEEEKQRKDSFQQRAHEMVEGYPIEKMLPYILERDEIVASYLIAIAKKESAWGKRVPVLNGKDCFNYWGYRGVRKKMGSGGHTCFNSRADAVKTVGDRLEWYIKQKNRTKPAELIVWKCGYSCDGHSKEGVAKWISDVKMYFDKLYNHE